MADDFTLPSDAPAPFALPSDSDADKSSPETPTFMGTLKSSLTAAPSNIYEAGKSALSNIWEGEQQRAKAAQENPSNVLTDWTGAGRDVLGLAAAPLTPVTKIGKAAAEGLAEPMTSAIQGAGTLAAHAVNSNPVLPSREDVYKQVEPDVETALGLATPRGASAFRAAPASLPAAPTPGPFGVTLSEGQATGDLSAIQREQGALRGTSGPGAQTRAQAFADQQRAELEAARDTVSRGLDPLGMQIAKSPQEAGTVASQGMQGAANQARAGVRQAYDVAQSYPGEIHAGVFEGMGQGIKGDLTLSQNPVIVDDKLTPFASKMVDDLDDRISQLRIQNKADPFGQPNPENITGVNLTGVEQMRKRLSAFRRGAFSNNAEDGRAAQAIIDAFDNRIDTAVNGGQFNGDPRAVQAWNDARAAYSDYRGNFTAGKNDPVGKVVEKITGRNGVGPTPAGPAIPNDVADYLYGAAGTNPSTLNVGVANRVRDMLGEQSPEWIGVKQGLFRRLVEPGDGMTPWGPGRTAQRLNQFLNVDGREMAATMYTPNERAMLQNYADLLRRIEVPQAGANWSNTATFMARAVNNLGGRLGMMVGAALGRTVVPFAPPLVAEGLGAAAANVAGRGAQAIQARAVARQMPLVAEQMQRWQRAMLAAQRANTPPSRATATAATLNLSRTLAPLGINFQQIAAQGPGNAYGQPNQQNVPGPPSQQQNGGVVRQRAKGGKVDSGEHERPLNRGKAGLARADGGPVDDPESVGGMDPTNSIAPLATALNKAVPNFDPSDWRPSTNIEDVRNKPIWRKAIETITRKPLPGDQTDYANGGEVKATKMQANYRGGTENKRCGNCKMFVVPDSCTAVRGKISPRGLCDFFESAGAKSTNGGRIDNVKIDAIHDGPWMSCMSIDGGTMYRNKNIPATANIKGKTVDVDEMLLSHEVPERADLEKLIKEFKERFHREPNVRERKAIYLKAHNRSGTPNERAHAKKIGVDWKAWSAWCRGEEAKIEKGSFTNQPKDADVKPISHSHGDLEAMDHASAA